MERQAASDGPRASGARALGRDTIAAVATGPAGAPRAVLRLSGPEAFSIAEAALLEARPKGRVARGGRIALGALALPALVLWMEGPRSYTGEDVVEFHVPGSLPLLRAALAHLLTLGARAAEPGEFTRRALENGRLDLIQAEAVAALVSAGAEDERRAALRLLGGGVGAELEAVLFGLLDLRALAEAGLDFDEADTGGVPRQELLAALVPLEAQLARVQGAVGSRAGRGALPRVVLLGRPNAGKSSLFNALAGGRALVSPWKGTTRDALTAPWRANGATVELVDLPGLEAGQSELDRAAQERAREWLSGADLVLWLARLGQAEGAAPERGLVPGVPWLGVWTAADAPLLEAEPTAVEARAGLGTWVRTSAHTGEGLLDLGRRVAEVLGAGIGALSGGLAPALSMRQAEGLRRAGAELALGRERLQDAAAMDLFAAHLARAGEALSDLLGQTTPEDVLDRIFARFCLGK